MTGLRALGMVLAGAAVAAAAPLKETRPMTLVQLRMEEEHAVVTGLHADSRALATVHGKRLHALVRGSRGWTLLTLDEHARRAAPDVPVPVVTATALAACGGRLLVGGTAPGGGWHVVVVDPANGNRAISVPSRPEPSCVDGRPHVLLREGDRFVTAELKDVMTDVHRVDPGGLTPEWSAAALADSLVVLRSGPGPIELVQIAGGKIVRRAAIAGTEGASAPALAEAGGRLLAAWAAPGAPDRLLFQEFDVALRPLGPARVVASLAEPHAVAASFVEPAAAGATIVGYVDRARRAGLPEAHTRSTWAAVVSGATVGRPQPIDPGGEAVARWVGDRLVVLRSPIGALVGSAWSLVP